jgi:phosphatidate cytidylyltransferase
MKRIITALILIPIIVWDVLYAPAWAFTLILAIIGGLAYHEYDTIVAENGILKGGFTGMACGIILLGLSYLGWLPNAWAVITVLAMLGMTLALKAADLKDSLSAGAAFLLGIVYIFGSWMCAVFLRAVNPHWLMIALLVSWAGDTAAMYIGKAFGKHKMAPRVSPGKTWEGAAGSVAGAILVGVIYAHYLIPSASILAAVVISAAGNFAGQIGDLSESALKRGAGVKDSGTMLPGHGGWLDRIDSSLFSIPAVYAMVFYFYAPLS